MTKPTLYDTIKENSYSNDTNRINQAVEVFNDALAECRKLNIAFIKAEYHGFGDSGELEEVSYSDKDGNPVAFDDDGAFLDVIWDLLPAGFENNLGGHGMVTIDLETNKVRIDHNQCVEHYEHEEFNIDL